MALSEHEQRMLQEMERALYAEDPRFASSIRDSRIAGARNPRNAVFALLAVVGVGLIGAGVSLQIPLLGVLGFALALAGLYAIVRAVMAGAPKPVRSAKPGRKSRPGFLKGAQDRFDQRRDGQQP